MKACAQDLTPETAGRVIGLAATLFLRDHAHEIDEAAEDRAREAKNSAEEAKNSGEQAKSSTAEAKNSAEESKNSTVEAENSAEEGKDSAEGRKKKSAAGEGKSSARTRGNPSNRVEEGKESEEEAAKSAAYVENSAEGGEPSGTGELADRQQADGGGGVLKRKAPCALDARLCVSAAAVMRAVELLTDLQAEAKPKTSLMEIKTENEFEKRLLSDVIPPEEVGVSFDDIGALDHVKDTLREMVMLPLQRPELFSRGNLAKPCRGILLFGPPGTGKTMLAKAVATEAGANFINVSMSSVASKWFGEGEKYMRAVFSLASKTAPAVVFIDEVDSMLGRRDKAGEHEAMRKIKNEFMANWDGLRTKENERVLVLAATNRPFDLDEAVVRRLPRRLMVDLPDAVNRQKILQVILGKEELKEAFDFEELAKETEGYSGSDLKNLCVAAAYRPIREIIEREKEEALREKKAKTAKAGVAEVAKSGLLSIRKKAKVVPREVPHIRPIIMEDFIKAKEQVCASVHKDAQTSQELQQWNEMYGEGGSRQAETLTYFM